MGILDRVKGAWNAFTSSDYATTDYSQSFGSMTSFAGRPDRLRRKVSNDRTILTSILTRISIDVASINIRHIELDDKNRYSHDLASPLNDCLTLEPNIDQGPRQFRQDMVMTLFEKGVMAIVPVNTDVDPRVSEYFDIYSLRVGYICDFYPRHVRVSVYDEKTGNRREIVLEKRFVAIVENPLYSVMNEPNSTLQRLIRKLSLLDAIDEQSAAGKLDLIIQLPYVIKSESRREQDEKRRKDIEFQLKGNQYGIAYTDGTEKITQLNRPAENNLLTQIEYLTKMLYGELGITEEVMNGTADEKAMLNYFNRTVEPVIDAIIEAMQRSFLGPMRTKEKERVKYYRDPFKFVPVAQVAEIADKFTRNEILSSNEIRGFLGIPPSDDPKADQLVNSNMPQPQPPVSMNFQGVAPVNDPAQDQTKDLESEMDSLEKEVDKAVKEFGQ